MNNGLPNYNLLVNTLGVYGTNLFAGFEEGLFLSTDLGMTWYSFAGGLNNATLVTNIAYDKTYFFVTTGEGSLLWRRPLSEIINSNAVETQAPPQTSLTAYPNPLSQSTTIRFTSVESGVARVTVVNLLGEEVARVFEGALTAGEHSFVWSKPTGLPAGMYECVVEMNGNTQQVPMAVTH